MPEAYVSKVLDTLTLAGQKISPVLELSSAGHVGNAAKRSASYLWPFSPSLICQLSNYLMKFGHLPFLPQVATRYKTRGQSVYSFSLQIISLCPKTPFTMRRTKVLESLASHNLA